MTFTKHDVTVMHVELPAACERVHNLIRMKEIAEFHKLEQMRHLRLRETLAAWKRDNGFDGRYQVSNS